MEAASPPSSIPLVDASVSNASSASAAGINRYLLAGAYHDKAFRNAVMSLLQDDGVRARAVEPGVDVLAIERNCRRANLHERARDICLTVVLLLAVTLVSFQDDSFGDPSSELLLAALCCLLIVLAEKVSTNRLAASYMLHEDRSTSGQDTESGFGPENVVVYGQYSPFVGFGYSIGGWSFAVNLKRPHEEFGTPAVIEPFETSDLGSFICERMDELDIRSLDHRTMLFVDGRSMREQSVVPFEDSRPVNMVPDATISGFDDLQWKKAIRRYLRISVVDWDGEVVLSIFLRFRKYRTSFFAESDYYVIPPLKQSFYEIDEHSSRFSGSSPASLLISWAMMMPVIVMLSPFNVIGLVTSPWIRAIRRRQTMLATQRNRRFNYGAVTSVRELASESNYRVYTQKLDQAMNLKVIEQQIIDALVEFLEAKGVDVSDIRDRRSTILNNGVIVSGGAVIADSMAVGVGASAGTSGITPPGASRRAGGAIRGASGAN